jgi:predicted PurR-regulated permease PerM
VSVPVIVVLAVVAMVSLVAIAAVVSQLLARLQRLARDLKEIEQTVMPTVARLQRDADVTGRELERLGQAVDELSEQRASR